MAKIMLEAAGLHLSYGERQLLKIEQLQIYGTDRIGLIGENGAGKTTLLQILAGEKKPASVLKWMVMFVRSVAGKPPRFITLLMTALVMRR